MLCYVMLCYVMLRYATFVPIKHAPDINIPHIFSGNAVLNPVYA